MAQGSDARDSGLIDRDGWIAYLQAHPGLAPDFARQAVGVPTVPSTVTAGDVLAFPVTKLDLTSLGAPQNTSLDVRIDGTSIGSAPVCGGNADVSVTVPAATAAGAHTLTLVAAPSGTTVTLPLTVKAAVPSSTTTLTASPASQVFGSSTRVLLTATVTATRAGHRERAVRVGIDGAGDRAARRRQGDLPAAGQHTGGHLPGGRPVRGGRHRDRGRRRRPYRCSSSRSPRPRR